jgi:hypothetical protein
MEPTSVVKAMLRPLDRPRQTRVPPPGARLCFTQKPRQPPGAPARCSANAFFSLLSGPDNHRRARPTQQYPFSTVAKPR